MHALKKQHDAHEDAHKRAKLDLERAMERHGMEKQKLRGGLEAVQVQHRLAEAEIVENFSAKLGQEQRERRFLDGELVKSKETMGLLAVENERTRTELTRLRRLVGAEPVGGVVGGLWCVVCSLAAMSSKVVLCCLRFPGSLCTGHCTGGVLFAGLLSQ